MKHYIIGILLLLSAEAGFASWNLELETGQVSAGYNIVQIPRTSGTRIYLKGDLNVDSREYYRLRLTKEIGEDKYISFLYAPLTVNASGVLAGNISFNNDIFVGGSRVAGRYRFDSYRVTYFKIFKKSDKLNYKLGFTAKIRDAGISLNDGTKNSEKKNTGFVPLLNFGLNYSFTDKLGFLVDGDALAGGPGRAEDMIVAFSYKGSEQLSYWLGYRFVEGGADAGEVFNFALLNYISAGVKVLFK
jgi:hypothetical protein